MENKILVETSARHMHLTKEAVEALYGKGAELKVKKMLSQPGQFASDNEKIKVVGPKGEMMVSVLGPTRPATQVELSYSDARALGLRDVPVRESGDVAGSPGVKLVGPAGEITIDEGVIIAKRHIHFNPEQAAGLGVENGEVVRVLIKSDRTTVYDDVVCRVNPNYELAMHIDTDECNAAGAFGLVYGEIVK
ncbi:MAG: phosphate propanoyltransferase [Ruminococcaceae bacterium]|nr:phosphate propanoyltransferase [Oscillospiraceae bacterium]